MAMTTDQIAARLREAGITLYQERSGFPLSQAQRNLSGKTHYVDDATIKSFKSRILSASVLDNGLVFGIVESIAIDPAGEERRFRPVFFDVFGNVIYRPDMENSFRTSKQASAAFWAQADLIDAAKVTTAGAEQKRNLLRLELDEYDKLIKALG